MVCDVTKWRTEPLLFLSPFGHMESFFKYQRVKRDASCKLLNFTEILITPKGESIWEKAFFSTESGLLSSHQDWNSNLDSDWFDSGLNVHFQRLIGFKGIMALQLIKKKKKKNVGAIHKKGKKGCFWRAHSLWNLFLWHESPDGMNSIS